MKDHRKGKIIKMTIKIPLTQEKFTLVDDEDYKKIRNIKFYAEKQDHSWYAKYSVSKHKKYYLHRLLLNAKKNELCDHINGDGLDNRRCNIRIVNTKQNMMNRKKYPINTSSKYKGVTWHKQIGAWQAQIQENSINHYLGVFIDEGQAARVYDEAAKKYFGEYAKLNFNRRRGKYHEL